MILLWFTPVHGNEKDKNEPKIEETEGDFEAYENKKLVDEISKKADEEIANNSNKKNGPCLTGVYDTMTGETFIFKNFSKNKIGKAEYLEFVENAHSIIKNRIKARQKLINEGGEGIPIEIDKDAGRHSETRALDEAIKTRELKLKIKVTEADLGSFDLHNRHMPSNTPMNRCGNCSHITNGVNVIGGHK